MNQEEIAKLVDEGRSIKDKVDALNARQDEIKDILRKEAKSRKTDHFLGNKHFTRISPDTTTDCDPVEFYNLMCDLDREAEAWGALKVLISNAKALVGETVFADISHVESIPYKKVSFLANIPKKYIKA